MLNKIDLLEGQLRGLESVPPTPTKVLPDMIDFDDDQLMFRFMDELKTRTIKGSSKFKYDIIMKLFAFISLSETFPQLFYFVGAMSHADTSLCSSSSLRTPGQLSWAG